MCDEFFLSIWLSCDRGRDVDVFRSGHVSSCAVNLWFCLSDSVWMLIVELSRLGIVNSKCEYKSLFTSGK